MIMGMCIGCSPYNAEQTVITQAIAVLRRFGSDAHVYLPGVGVINGLQASNYLDSAGTTVGTVDQPVGLVQDTLGGIHASQATTAQKPILRRGAVNLLTYSGDMTLAPWGDVRSNRGIDTVTATATSVNGFAIASALVSATSTTATAQVELKKGASDWASVLFWDGAANGVRQWVNLISGALASTATLGTGWGIAQAEITAGAVGHYILTLRVSKPAVTAGVNIYSSTQTDGGYGCNIGDIGYIRRVAIYSGTYTAAQIQALGGIPLTTTAPASTALGPMHWAFDGSNDSLSLGGPLFQMADDHCVVAGVSPSGAFASTHFFQSGNGASSQQVCTLKFQANGRVSAVWVDDAVNIAGPVSTAPVVANTAYVVTGRRLASTGSVRLNGAQNASLSLSGIGATTLTLGGVIGSYKAGGAPFPGAIYPVIAIKGTVTDPDLLLLERFIGQLSGVQI